MTKAIKAEREKPGDDKAKNKATGCISPSINKAKREESGDDKGPYFWMRELENWSYMDEEIHESTFYLLDKAISRDYNSGEYSYFRVLCNREKLKSDLSMIAKKEGIAVSFGKSAIFILNSRKFNRSNVEGTVSLALLNINLLNWDRNFAVGDANLIGESIEASKFVLDDLKKMVGLENKEELMKYLQDQRELKREDSPQAYLDFYNYLFLLGTITFKIADLELESYLRSLVEMIKSAKDIDLMKQYIPLRNHLDLSMFCFSSIILFKPILTPNIFYSLKFSYYLVESGIMLLELGKLKNLLGTGPSGV